MEDSLPVKLFEYMSAGLLFVASDFPLWRQIGTESGAGICFDSMDPTAIAGAIQEILDDGERLAKWAMLGGHTCASISAGRMRSRSFSSYMMRCWERRAS